MIFRKAIPFDSADAPPRPSKIVAVGRNYREHAAELGNAVPDAEPLLFLKAPSSLVIDGSDIVLPPESARVDYEGELALMRRSTSPERASRRSISGISSSDSGAYAGFPFVWKRSSTAARSMRSSGLRRFAWKIGPMTRASAAENASP